MNDPTQTTAPPTGRANAWAAHLGGAMRRAAQWRLLLLWLVALAIPLVMLCLPLWLALGGPLDHALLGKRLVEGFDPVALAESLGGLRERGYSPVSGAGALIVFVLLLPWLTGTVMAAARAPQPLGFGALLRGGLAEYWRMARLWVWALVPLGIAGALGAAAVNCAKELALKLTLEADADHLQQAAVAVAALLFLFAHATVDAARAQLVIEPRRRSVVRAWWRATARLIRRPGRVLLYLAITAIGLLLAAAIGWLRVQWPPVTTLAFVGALVLGQALVLALAWMRCARLFALVRSGRG
jgi:hypothetical protein